MNYTKYLHFFVFMSLFFTWGHQIDAHAATAQKSTTTQKTTPQKKEVSTKKSENSTHRPAKKTNITSNAQQCPHANKPLASLNETELAEILTCTQDQKTKITNTVQTIENLIEQKQEQKKHAKKEKNRKKHQQKNRCPYNSSPLKNLNASQLEEVYDYTQTHKKDPAFMISLLERLIALSDNHASVKKYKLQLADTHYIAHHIEKAAAFYEDFAVMYPGSKECEYVLYKAVACMFELSLEPDRDQTNTKKTIGLIKEFLKRAATKELIDEANQMLQQCYQRLYDHEVYVFNFYTKKKNFTAAQLRLDYLGKTFSQTITNLDEKLAALKKQLELAKNPVKKPAKYFINRYLA